MNSREASVESLVRQAFGLLLELRQNRHAQRLLPLAVAYLETLCRDTTARELPVIVSVRAVQFR